MKIELKAHVKMVLHASKYTSQSVFGFLIGKKGHVHDALPVSHTGLALAPLLDISGTQAEIFAKKNDMQVVGAYYFPVVEGLVPHISRIATVIDETLGGGAVLLLVIRQSLRKGDNEMLKNFEKAPFHEYTFANGHWKQQSSSTIVADEKAKLFLKNQITLKRHHQLVDFENHLDDISLDWLENPEIIV